MGRFALLNLESTCGNLLGKRHCRQPWAGRKTALPSGSMNSPCRALALFGNPFRPFAPLLGALGKPMRKFQDLRAMSMTNNERTRSAIPHQSIRILSCPCRFFSPWRQKNNRPARREKKTIRRIRHGVARAIEDLRRMRLSLVPHPDSGNRLLPGM
jgi:hypothetical protein